MEQQPELVKKVEHALLIPDYLSYRLTGNMNWEYTNATTTQMVNINTDNWDEHLLTWTGASPSGSARQPIRQCHRPVDLPAGNEIPVVAVASHDTASAVIASPLASKDAAYLSSGTGR